MWRRYKSDGGTRVRERLVVAYSPLVKYVAGRTAAGLPPHMDEADLISYGLLGLTSAIECFDIRLNARNRSDSRAKTRRERQWRPSFTRCPKRAAAHAQPFC